jgi:hypothetical protein
MRLLRSALTPASAGLAFIAFAPAAPRAMGATAFAQSVNTRDAFNWSGEIESGHWIRLHNLNGAVTVEPTNGDKVEVKAVERWRRGDTSSVHFTVQKIGSSGKDVLICALWGRNSDCDEHGYHVHSDDDEESGGRRNRSNDVNVEFHVLVPRGVRVAMNTVNGGVHVTGMTSEVRAGTVNGEVDVTTQGGPVSATTVNGSVHANVGRVGNDDEMSFGTVNGSVIVTLPPDVSTDVDISTLNGAIRTDYALSVTGRIDRRHVNAHVGKPGGGEIRLRTVNGSVELRKGG